MGIVLADGVGVAVYSQTIDKQSRGDLEGSSKVEMLTAGTAVRDSAKMDITIADGKHSYDFEYTLAGTP